MNPNLEKALNKLAKGRDKLSLEEIMVFIAEAPSLTKEQVAQAIAPKRKSSPRKPTPAWIAEVQKEFKLVGWSKERPGPKQLIEFANSSGKLGNPIGIPNKLTLPAACKKIEAIVGEEVAKQMAFELVEQKRKTGARV